MNRTRTTLLAVVSIAALLAAGAWYHARSALHDSRAQLLRSTLQPIASMLKENQALIQVLQAEPFTERESGILESYLA